MRLFHYSATDKQGRLQQGTLQAADAVQAQQMVAQRGLVLRDLQDTSPRSAASTPQIILEPSAQVAPPAVRQAPPLTSSPQSPPISVPKQPQGATKVAHSQTSAPPTQVHTPMGYDKDRFFLFAQLSAAYRAGINPAVAFNEIAPRTRGIFAQSLVDASGAAAEGRPVSEVFARYPDLYPEHVVGMTRAGEQGGFMPEAFEEISRQAESAHKFKRWFFWIWFVVLNGLLSIPIMFLATRSLITGWEQIDKSGGVGADGKPMSVGEGAGTMFGAYLPSLIWPWGPLIAAIWLTTYLLYRYFGSRIAKRLRHKVGLHYPVFGARARHECYSRFSWTMARLAKSGLPPHRSWQLAADTIPNLEMRDRVAYVGSQLHGAERLSDIIGRSRLFPEQYAPVVATAEYTGDIPGAMEQLAQISQGEFQTAQNYAKARAGCWGLLGLFVTSGILAAILWYTWYHELPAKILEGME